MRQVSNLILRPMGKDVAYYDGNNQIGTLTMFSEHNAGTYQLLQAENRKLRKEIHRLENELVSLRTKLRRMGRA